MTDGVMYGGDFSCDFIFDEVTQEDKDEDDEAQERSCNAILRDPGPGLTRAPGMTLTKENTGTVTVLGETAELERALREP